MKIKHLTLILVWFLFSHFSWVLVIKFLKEDKGFDETLFIILGYSTLPFFLGFLYLLYSITSKKRSTFLTFSFVKHFKLCILSLCFHSCFIYGIGRLPVISAVCSILLDPAFIAIFSLFSYQHVETCNHIFAVFVLLVGFFVVSTIRYPGSGWNVEFNAPNIEGLIFTTCGRLFYVYRGFSSQRYVISKYAAHDPQNLEGVELINQRHLFPRSGFSEKHKLRLDRVFGSGLYMPFLVGQNLTMTNKFHIITEFFLQWPVAAILAYYFPLKTDKSFDEALDIVISSLYIYIPLIYISISQLTLVLLDYGFAFSISPLIYMSRDLFGMFIMSMFSVRFESELEHWDRIRALGALFMVLGYIIIYRSIYNGWRNREAEKDIEMIGHANGLSEKEVDLLRKARLDHTNEEFQLILMKNALRDSNALKREDEGGGDSEAEFIGGGLLSPRSEISESELEIKNEKYSPRMEQHGHGKHEIENFSNEMINIPGAFMEEEEKKYEVVKSKSEVCSICNLEGGKMLYCSWCKRAYHLPCYPGKFISLVKKWRCSLCRSDSGNKIDRYSREPSSPEGQGGDLREILEMVVDKK